MKACLILLLALSAGALVSARVFQDDGHSSRSLAQIQLGASAFCPDGCDRVNGGCVQDNTMAGLRCQDCLGNLLVNKVTGNCTCPAGKYADKANNCADCPKGKYCPGGAYSITKAGVILAPLSYDCPLNMTTVGRRSVTIRACVQDPGFSYSISADGTVPTATLCPANTYSAGLKKQRACVPCPTGFITDPSKPNQLRTSPTQCLVPAGYYLKAPGQVAACPEGEYKEGLATGANCTKCAFGVTTATEGSTSRWNCTILLPGYYAAEMNTTTNTVLRVAICPQGYFCPGGAPNATFVPTPAGRRLLQAPGSQIEKCRFDAWTQEPGATSAEQCLVPPGYYFDANNTRTVKKCPDGSFRADWLNANDLAAQSCISCGLGVKAVKTDLVKAYNVTDVTLTWFEEVTTSSDDCYIEAGQALYYESLTQTYRAVNCADDNYGVTNRTYGWTPIPCKACPSNMVAINSATYSQSALYWTNSTDGSAYGFTSPLACVTINGYGYNSRVAQACEKGYYNALNNREDCKPCGYGLTTAGVGQGFVEGDCGIAPGFGYVGSTIRECPIGQYNDDAIDPNRKAPCTPCPVGLTTQGTGSTNSSQCNLCAIGYGGYQCNTTCGGDINSTVAGAVYPGTYGNDGRAWIESDPNAAACTECTRQETGYSFSWQFTNDNYSVPSISPVMANASTDCLAKYSQTLDGAWFMPDTPNSVAVTTGVTSFAACVTICDAQKTVEKTPGCQWVTYDYVSQNCSVRYIARQIYVGAPVVGFKAVPSGDVGTNAFSLAQARSFKIQSLVEEGMEKSAAKALASGRYTFYQDEYGLQIGNWSVETETGIVSGQKVPDNVQAFTKWQDCLNACDDDYLCTAFIIQLTVIKENRPKTCRLVYGRKDVGEFKRTFVRADISRLNDISGNLDPQNNLIAG